MKKYAVDLAIQFPTKSILTAFGLHRDHPPAWEVYLKKLTNSSKNACFDHNSEFYCMT